MISNKLIIKNVPSEFTDSDKIEFFTMFGGKDVINLNGKMKHCCVVSFLDHYNTKKALETLHQFEVLGNRLVVEYLNSHHEKNANRIQTASILNKTSNLQESEKADKEKEDVETFFEKHKCGIAPKLNVLHDIPEHLSYKYPDPNITILTNIANALATVPKFYTQVLHLMNKMNLPPPFSSPTVIPPLPGDSILLKDVAVDTTDLEGFFSSEESEIESETELNQKHQIYEKSSIAQPLRKRKRMKVITKFNQEKLKAPHNKTNKEVSLHQAFELASTSKRFEFKLASSIQEAVDGRNKSVSYNVFDERGEFGKIQPDKTDNTDIVQEDMQLEKKMESDSDEYDESGDNYEFASLDHLNQNRMSEKEILDMPQFKNYTPGEVTNRLYIKNLAKQVTENDLKFIFQRFVSKLPDNENLLELRLMQEGRMKGQAFITFPSEKLAVIALKMTHGYILHSKPMIIQFGRSTKQTS